jgi:hypothetical protein
MVALVAVVQDIPPLQTELSTPVELVLPDKVMTVVVVGSAELPIHAAVVAVVLVRLVVLQVIRLPVLVVMV